MDRISSQLFLVLTVILGLIGTFILSRVFITNQNLKWKNKAQANKMLLKQLLEGFGLEIPSELNEVDGSIIKSIKGR
tara:strand:- start:259 stop:489 length:231 start_codon:yes stop_codon:yes gene_type:complete